LGVCVCVKWIFTAAIHLMYTYKPEYH
jgi:hypothetical protein